MLRKYLFKLVEEAAVRSQAERLRLVDARYRAGYSVSANDRTGVEDRGFSHGALDNKALGGNTTLPGIL